MKIAKIIMSMFLLCNMITVLPMNSEETIVSKGKKPHYFKIKPFYKVKQIRKAVDFDDEDDEDSLVAFSQVKPVVRVKPSEPKLGKVIVIGGISSSGKSTIVRKLKDQYRFTVIAFDDNVTGDELHGLEVVVQKAKEEFERDVPYAICDIPVEDKNFYENIYKNFSMPILFIWVEVSLESLAAQINSRNVLPDSSEHRSLYAPFDQYLRTHKLADSNDRNVGELSFKFVHNLLKDPQVIRRDVQINFEQKRLSDEEKKKSIEMAESMIKRFHDNLFNEYYKKFFEKFKRPNEPKDIYIERMLQENFKVHVNIDLEPAPKYVVFNHYYPEAPAREREMSRITELIFNHLQHEGIFAGSSAMRSSAIATPSAGFLAAAPAPTPS